MKTFTKISLSLILVFTIAQLKAQSVGDYLYGTNIQWVQFTGHQDSIIPNRSVRKNGNLYIAGFTVDSLTGADILVTKYDVSGTLVWQHTYSSSGYHRDQATAIAVDDEENVYVTGVITIDTANTDYVTLKYNAAGAQQWAETYDGPGHSYDVPASIFVNGHNVYVTGASTGSSTLLDYATIKYDSTGSQLWVSRYDTLGLMDAAIGVTVDGSNHVIVTGGAQTSLADYSYAILSYDDATGSRLGISLSTAVTGFDVPSAVVVDAHNNVYVTGSFANPGKGMDYKTIKIDASGTVDWERTYDYDNEDDIAADIEIGPGGLIAVTGKSKSATNGWDYATIAYDSTGAQLWGQRFEGRANGDDMTGKFVHVFDGSPISSYILVSGISGSKLTLVGYLTDGTPTTIFEYNVGTFSNYTFDPDFDEIDINDVYLDGSGNLYYSGQIHTEPSGDVYFVASFALSQYQAVADSELPPSSFAFYKNYGQIIDNNDSVRHDVNFYTTSSYPAMYVRSDTMSFVFSRLKKGADASNDSTGYHSFASVEDTTAKDTLARVDMFFHHTGDAITPIAILPEVPQYLNYFLPQCGANGITNVDGYQRLYVPNVYSGIDVMYTANNAGLKYYIICNPGSVSPNYINMEFSGNDSLYIDDSATLHVTTAIGELTFKQPVAYEQEADGSLTAEGWAATYSINPEDGSILISHSTYNTDKRLVYKIERGSGNREEATDNIDWSTFLQGSVYDHLVKMTTNNAGIIDAIGITEGDIFLSVAGKYTNFQGTYDIYVTQIAEDPGKFNWTTYFGGSGDNYGTSVAVANDGSVVICGYMTNTSSDFPTQTSSSGNYNNATYLTGPNAFVASLNSKGTTNQWCALLGPGQVYDVAIDVDNTQSIYVVGEMAGTSPAIQNLSGAYNQPAIAGGIDGAIFSFDNTYNLLWGSYFGGYVSAELSDDKINAVAIDHSGNICITGNTEINVKGDNTATDPPTNNGFPYLSTGSSYNQDGYSRFSTFTYQDAFVAKFTPDDALFWSTFFGGSNFEESNGIAVDNSNDIYIVGMTNTTPDYAHACSPSSGGFPLCNYWQYTLNGTQDAFFAEFDENGGLLFSTVYGGALGSYKNGTGVDFGKAVAVDRWNNVYFTGGTVSTDYPNSGQGDYLNHGFYGSGDAFIAEAAPDHSPLWSTCLGGSADYEEGDCILYTPENSGNKHHDNLYIGGFSASSDYPVFPTPSANYPTSFAFTNNANHSVFTRFYLDIATGVKEASAINTQNGMFIYPNPNEGTIRFAGNEEFKGPVAINVYNDMGQLMLTKIVNSSTELYDNSINLSNLPNGLYLIHISSQGKIQSVKCAIAH